MDDATPRRRRSLVVFSDDWGRHPSSCQHLIGRLVGRHDVLWVNTIGMRPPRLDRSTLSRGLEKLSQWGREDSGGSVEGSSCSASGTRSVLQWGLFAAFALAASRRRSFRAR